MSLPLTLNPSSSEPRHLEHFKHSGCHFLFAALTVAAERSLEGGDGGDGGRGGERETLLSLSLSLPMPLSLSLSLLSPSVKAYRVRIVLPRIGPSQPAHLSACAVRPQGPQ